MASDPIPLLLRRLREGLVSVEALVLRGPEAVVGRRLVLDPAGVLLAGEAPEGARSGLEAGARRLGPGRRCLLLGPDQAGGHEVYLERWAPPPRLVIFGGGHIGRALCAALRDLEFRVHVVEDRAYFADAGRFEGRVRCLQAPLPEGADRLEVGPEDLVVIATRGHSEDLGCLRAALRRRPAYLGLLGSRRKLREFLRVLAAEGIDPAGLSRVRCPVGLDIGAETPEEIAVAVAAELVAFGAGRAPPPAGAAPA